MMMNCSNFSSVYWVRDIKLVHLTQQEFKNKIEELNNKGYNRIPLCSKVDSYLFQNNYSIKKTHNWLTLFVVDNEKFIRYQTNWYDTNKNGQEGTGSKAIKLVTEKFEGLTGTTFKKAFDTVEEEYKRCVPKQFAVGNKVLYNKELVVSSIDACSHYPSCMRGRLPDAHTAIKVKGRVKPTEDRPFAFYIKSGHCAEYGVFDTHEWFNSPFALSLFRFEAKKEAWPILTINDTDEITVLMKASEYELTEVYNYFYNIKQTYDNDTEEYNNAKLVMNSSIGMMHTKRYRRYKYAHLVAIALGRANQKMIELANRIGIKDIIQICVDGIMYRGTEVYGSDEKGLGKLYQEFTGLTGLVSGLNKYVVMGPNSLVEKAKWQGMTNYTDGRKITLKSVVSLYDQYDWIRIDPLEELKNEETL